MTTLPTEPPGGQDDPPDVRTAVRAVLVLLADVGDHLEVEPHGAELLERVRAVRRAMVRLRDSL